MRKSTIRKRLEVLIQDARFQRELLMTPDQLFCPFPEHRHDCDCYHNRSICVWNGKLLAYQRLWKEITGNREGFDLEHS